MGNHVGPGGVPPVVHGSLVEQARAGDAHAFAALVREHQGAALRCARSHTTSAADAEEAVQEALVKAWAALPRFRPGAAFAPWFLTIVANEARSRTRAESRRVAWLQALAREPAPDADGDGPEAELLAGERRAALARALAALPDRDREALGLRFADDLSEQEMAEALRVRPGTVKSRLSRALDRLRADPAARGALLGGAAALVAAALVAVPDTRAALLDVLGLRGGERVVQVGAPPVAPARPAPPGRPADVREATRILGRVPFALPGATGLRARDRVVTVTAAGATLDQVAGSATVFAQKQVGPGTEAREVTIGGEPGLLLTGAPHAWEGLRPDGTPIVGSRRLVDATVVLWDRAGIGLRLETRASPRRALALAAAVR